LLERLDEADDVLTAGLARLQADEAIWLEFVRLPILQGNHCEAARRWYRFAQAMPDRKKELSQVRAKLRETIAVSRLGLDVTAAASNEWIRGTVISEDPVIILSINGPAFPTLEKTAPYYQDRQVYFLIGLPHTILIDPDHRKRVCDRYYQVIREYPNFDITILATDVAELRMMRQHGIRCELINQNAFVDENI